MMNIHSKYEKMHKNGMLYGLNCIKNHVIIFSSWRTSFQDQLNVHTRSRLPTKKIKQKLQAMKGKLENKEK